LEKTKKASPNRALERTKQMKVESRSVEMYIGKLRSCQESTFLQNWWTFANCVHKYCTAVLQQESKPNTSMIW